MTELTQEKWLQDISIEAKNSSPLRLLYELIQWDDKATAMELDILCKELSERGHNKGLLSARLFLVCFLQANFGATFKEKFYVFDEDEQEVRRQLRLGFFTHLAISMVIIMLVPTITAKCILLTIYILATAKWSLDFLRPVNKRLNKFYR